VDLRESRQSELHPGRRHPWELARLEIVYELLMAPLAGQTPRVVLDIGCGDAFVAGELSRRLPETTFVAVDTELDDAFMDSLTRQLSGQRIALFKSLEAAAAQVSQPADVVLLLDVIEHIEDDIGFLVRLRGSPFITDETLFVITVPAFQRLFCSRDLFLGHFRRYDNRMLIEHLARAGYRTERIGYLFFTGLIARSLQVWREWRSPAVQIKAVDVSGWRGGPMTTRLARRLLLLEYACSRFLRLLGIRLPGLTNYALCKTSVS
jgi:hypothetical protein